ncbi:MAG: FAD binding domain-containing protein [Rhodoferax sp.]|nr:FAD binding domain-containing protein [Rhodoferax sp.]MCF8208281.1 FAD binding domain-containing protein [Rhodoferax sp.]
MNTTTLNYATPDSLQGVLSLLAQAGSRVLPTSASLPKAVDPGTTLVSLRKVPGLSRVHADADALHIGTSVAYAQLQQSQLLAGHAALVQALASIREPHLRNHCTLGGALHEGGVAHAPVLAALMALDAHAIALGADGSSESLPLEAFSAQGQRVPFASDKLASEVTLAAVPGAFSSYYALSQLSGFEPDRGIAMGLRLSGRTVESVRLVLAGFSEQPMRLPAVEAALVGGALDVGRIAQASEQVSSLALSAQRKDIPQGYLQQLAKTLIRRVLGQF